MISRDDIRKAEEVLIDNGIEKDEAPVVLQALGYVLLDKELYPDDDAGEKENTEETVKKNEPAPLPPSGNVMRSVACPGAPKEYTNNDRIRAFLESADEVALKRFWDVVVEQMDANAEPDDDKARTLLSTILHRSADEALHAMCGWGAHALLAKARLVPDVHGWFHNRIADAEFVSLWDGERTEIVTRCKVNMETFEVFDIAQSENDEVEVCDGEYIRFHEDPGQQYPVFRKEELQEPIINFWYD